MRGSSLSVCAALLVLGCRSHGDTDAGRIDERAVPEPVARPEAGPSPEVGVRYVGRFDDSDPSVVRLSWSGSGFVVRFRGTGARATLRGGRYFTVIVDGHVRPEPLAVSDDDAVYDLASGLSDGEHTVEAYRRTSASFGPTVVGGVEVDGALLAVPRPLRQVEILGDSWSTGHGVEGPDGSCKNTAEVENHFVTWAAIAARALDAELSVVAMDGKGVARNEDGDRMQTMPILYDRVIATEAGSTGTIRPADVVFVSLGANDLRDGELPRGFTRAYVSVLEQVRARHPDAVIACIWPKLPDAGERARARSAIDAAIADRSAAGDAQVTGADVELDELVDFGCNQHPGGMTQALMADHAIAFLRAELGW